MGAFSEVCFGQICVVMNMFFKICFIKISEFSIQGFHFIRKVLWICSRASDYPNGLSGIRRVRRR